jgi:hypothetical protein
MPAAYSQALQQQLLARVSTAAAAAQLPSQFPRLTTQQGEELLGSWSKRQGQAGEKPSEAAAAAAAQEVQLAAAGNLKGIITNHLGKAQVIVSGPLGTLPAAVQVQIPAQLQQAGGAAAAGQQQLKKARTSSGSGGNSAAASPSDTPVAAAAAAAAKAAGLGAALSGAASARAISTSSIAALQAAQAGLGATGSPLGTPTLRPAGMASSRGPRGDTGVAGMLTGAVRPPGTATITTGNTAPLVITTQHGHGQSLQGISLPGSGQAIKLARLPSGQVAVAKEGSEGMQLELAPQQLQQLQQLQAAAAAGHVVTTMTQPGQQAEGADNSAAAHLTHMLQAQLAAVAAATSGAEVAQQQQQQLELLMATSAAAATPSLAAPGATDTASLTAELLNAAPLSTAPQPAPSEPAAPAAAPDAAAQLAAAPAPAAAGEPGSLQGSFTSMLQESLAATPAPQQVQQSSPLPSVVVPAEQREQLQQALALQGHVLQGHSAADMAALTQLLLQQQHAQQQQAQQHAEHSPMDVDSTAAAAAAPATSLPQLLVATSAPQAVAMPGSMGPPAAPTHPRASSPNSLLASLSQHPLQQQLGMGVHAVTTGPPQPSRVNSLNSWLLPNALVSTEAEAAAAAMMARGQWAVVSTSGPADGVQQGGAEGQQQQQQQA